MKRRLKTTIGFGILIAGFILLNSFSTTKTGLENPSGSFSSDDKLEKVAFEILDTKCNACHRKQNPFMVFKEKNISKRAKKIYQLVFAERRMPKGDEIRLSNEEYIALEKWLFTQEIF